jgi:hypothetical protein
MGVEASATDRQIAIDGVSAASSTASLGLLSAIARLSLGYNAIASNGQYVSGSIIAAALGWGAVPDLAALSADWLSGTFAAAGGGASANLPAILNHLRMQGMA